MKIFHSNCGHLHLLSPQAFNKTTVLIHEMLRKLKCKDIDRIFELLESGKLPVQ